MRSGWKAEDKGGKREAERKRVGWREGKIGMKERGMDGKESIEKQGVEAAEKEWSGRGRTKG